MNGSPVQNYYLDVNTTGGLINLNLCPCVCSWEWIVSCVLRCSWQTLPMCSCWSRVRMCPSCWRTSWRCAELCSASTATLLWSKAWTARPGQSHRTQQHWISIELCSALAAVHKHSAYCVHHIILGSSCCRCCWGSQKQSWRDHWRTKEKTCSPTAWPASSSKWVQMNKPRLHTHHNEAELSWCAHIVPCLQLTEANTIYKQRFMYSNN